MVTLVIGGIGSGKSACAERLLEEISDVENKYYLATMRVLDEAGRERRARHRRQRRGKGFLTIEQPRDIGQVVRRMKPGANAALLECISNLAANEMFDEGISTVEDTVRRTLEGIRQLRAELCHLVIVTNDGFEDDDGYDEETKNYLEALAQINRVLFEEADMIVEVGR